jgi:hypothetical protein
MHQFGAFQLSTSSLLLICTLTSFILQIHRLGVHLDTLTVFDLRYLSKCLSFNI